MRKEVSKDLGKREAARVGSVPRQGGGHVEFSEHYRPMVSCQRTELGAHDVDATGAHLDSYVGILWSLYELLFTCLNLKDRTTFNSPQIHLFLSGSVPAHSKQLL